MKKKVLYHIKQTSFFFHQQQDIHTSSMERSNIEFPQLLEEDLVTYYAQLRPYRKGGVRIQKEIIDGKYVIHNYGHAGSGVSLSPVTTYQAVNLGYNLIKQNPNIAIIGCGIMGLMTARQILRRVPKAKITVYSQQFPNFGNKDNRSMITSEVAPGYWLPYDYQFADIQAQNRFSRYCFQWYDQMSKQQNYKQCIKKVVVYDFSEGKQKDQSLSELNQDIKNTLKNATVTLNNKTKVQCMTYKTFKIDLQLFLKFLMNDIKERVIFVKRKIVPTTLKETSQNIIFNCAGLGSRQLFGDTKMKGIKGHLLQYKNIGPEKYDYFVRVNAGGSTMFYYMHSSRIIMGWTVQNQENREVNQNVVKNLKEIHQHVLQKFNLKNINPKL